MERTYRRRPLSLDVSTRQQIDYLNGDKKQENERFLENTNVTKLSKADDTILRRTWPVYMRSHVRLRRCQKEIKNRTRWVTFGSKSTVSLQYTNVSCHYSAKDRLRRKWPLQNSGFEGHLLNDVNRARSKDFQRWVLRSARYRLTSKFFWLLEKKINNHIIPIIQSFDIAS